MTGVWVELERVSATGVVDSSPLQVFCDFADSSSCSSSVTIDEYRPARSGLPTTPTFDFLKGSAQALDFGRYFSDKDSNHLGLSVVAMHRSTTLFEHFDNCEVAGLEVEQLFMFSPYGNSIPHEPSGALTAARFHPVTRYRLLPNSSWTTKAVNYRIRSIRFDYRFHMGLRRLEAAEQSLPNRGNQAGLFADRDNGLDTIARALIGTVGSARLSEGLSKSAFEAVEKPVVLEVIAPGLRGGFPMYRDPATKAAARCWDNVHYWSAGPPGSALPSTPGAFHAAHLHWRWGESADLNGADSAVFDPPTWAKIGPLPAEGAGRWGPLVDPAVWTQTINVAITRASDALDPDTVSGLSPANWASLFGGPPSDIEGGTNLVIWYTTKVSRRVTFIRRVIGAEKVDVTTELGGSVMIHGMFFAHNPEPTGFGLTGSTRADHRPKSSSAIRGDRKRFRPAYSEQ